MILCSSPKGGKILISLVLAILFAARSFASAIAVSQELLYGHQAARIKYSCRESGLAQYRPGDHQQDIAFA